jgi:uncharacterized protein (DUF1800 family)
VSFWNPYEPSSDAPWNLKRVLHLHRRVVFGATWNEIQRDLHDAPQAAVDRVLKGTCRSEGVPPEFEELSQTIAKAAVDSASPARLAAWWLYRCLFTPDPLAERLTLMWHNHFATSIAKVNNVRWMQRQNETLRRQARGTFHDLLTAMLADPALLVWLDAPENRPGHPNENLARELMELFTLGIGHYTELDVREAARALTGLRIRDGIVQQDADRHDGGTKSILGTTGAFNAADLAEWLVQHEATSHRVAWRLCSEFFGEGVLDAEGMNELASGLRAHQLRIEWGVETILRSAKFFSDANLQSRVSDPAAFLLAPLRALEGFRDPPNTLAAADALRHMGEDLFAPPNVAGWPGGRMWLSTQTIIARSNVMADFLGGRYQLPPRPWNPEPLLKRHHVQGELSEVVRFFGELLFGEVDRESLSSIARSVDRNSDQPAQIRQALIALVTRPQAHLH